MTYDLFTYPQRPGYRHRETSIEAAGTMERSAPQLRARCLQLFLDHRVLTADEVAKILGCSVLSIRPRITELAKLGKIVDANLRRANESGRRAIVWRKA